MDHDNLDTKTPKVSMAIKIPILILTLLTLAALGAVFNKMMSSPLLKGKKPAKEIAAESPSPWVGQLPDLALKLEENGLVEEALIYYVRYLEKSPVQGLERAEIAHRVGLLYQKLGNCSEALVWFFHSEINQPELELQSTLNKNIDACMASLRNVRK
ncbi:MAG: hypothetical protein G3M78_09660 [Candidatus Nitrohelix vancouverensis]|uniref:Tetratricopeptide repeat protein n=1 Tax=Candidatus Nitrohelix vancouverensis TaxID=2705534 RepID=A0A7T0G3S3_9BACT|nr:MAG: hypothetical protein G3M78_09660 [Candidatus Nitrohelix vancouverensis]